MMRSVRLGLWSLFLIPAAVTATPVQPAQPVITGTVLADDGRPLAGAQVELLPILPVFEQAGRSLDAAEAPAAAATSASDATGRFSLRAPEPGLWTVVVRSTDRVPIQQSPLPLVAPVELAPAVLVSGTGAPLRLGGWRTALRSESLGPQGNVRLPRRPGPAPSPARCSTPAAASRSRKRSSGRPWTQAPSCGRTARDVSASHPPCAAGSIWRPSRPGICRSVRRSPGRSSPPAGAATLALAEAGTVLGRVVDPRGKPLSGAAVTAVPAAALGDRAFDPSDPVADRAFTDAQGPLRAPPPASRAELRGARGAERRLPRGAEHRGGRPRAASPRNLTLVLAPARSARGRVQDPEGRPIAGAEVLVRPALRTGQESFSLGEGEGEVRAESDAQGVFSFPECPAAEVELAVRKTGFAPSVLPALRIASGTGPADLGRVTLRPGARLAGRVVDRRDRGVPGAEVFPLDRPPGFNQAERALQGKKPAATTAADGSFTIENLARGTPVHLIVRAPGHLHAEVRAVRPPTAKLLRIRLEPEAVLRGRVVDTAGEPVAGARLNLRWQEYLPEDPERQIGEPVFRSARSEADGRFEMRGIPEGSVIFGVSAQGFVSLEGLELELPRPADAGELRLVLDRGAVLQGRVTTVAGEPVPAVRIAVGGAAAATGDDGFYWLEGAEPGPRDVLFLHPSHGRLEKPFEIQPGVNVLDVSFESGVEVSGRVVDETGKPVAGARVELGSRGRGGRQFQDVTGDDGRFRLSPVVDGTYRLQAEAPGYSETEPPAAIEVAGAPVSNLEVILERGAVLSGKILGLAPEELAGIKIEARGDLGATVAAWTDGRGNYEIRPLRPGDWVVRASLWDEQRQAKIRLVVRRTDRDVTRDIEFEPRLTLTAQVLYDDEPLPGTKLSLRGQRIAAERIATSDYEGRVRIDDLLPDTYRLGVGHPGKMLVHNDQIDLREDRDLVIRLETSNLTGLVVSGSGGEPVADALLILKPVEGPEFMVTAGTKADGRFGLYRVPPGRYRLTASAEGFSPAEQQVEAAPGATVDGLEIQLTPAAGARVQVRLASGQIPETVHLLVRDPAGAAVLAETRWADESGLLKLSKLPAGAWTLLLRADGGALSTVQLLVPSEPLAVTLPPAGQLAIRVPALATSDLLATVRLLGADQQPFWTLAPGGQIEQQWTLTGGRGIIDGVPAGSWIVQVESTDGQRWQGVAATSGAGETAVTVE